MPTIVELAREMIAASENVRADIVALLQRMRFDPARDSVLIPVHALQRIIATRTSDFPHTFRKTCASPISPEVAMRYLHALGIENLIKCSYPYRGALWSPTGEKPVTFYVWSDKSNRRSDQSA